MITEIYIDNLVIIDQVTIRLEPGLNVITGETGAGKSVVIQALELLMGERASRELVGKLRNKTIVEGVFQISQQVEEELRREYGVESEEMSCIVTREISEDGKSISRINGRQVTLSVLKGVISKLVDIHGQHANQQLAGKKNYILLLDDFVQGEIPAKKQRLSSLLKEKRALEMQVAQLDLDPSELHRRLDLIHYQLEDIASLDLEKISLEEVEREYQKLVNAQDIMIDVGRAKSLISADEIGDKDLMGTMSEIIRSLERGARFDPNLEEYCETLRQAGYILDDVYRELDHYSQSLSTDEKRIRELDDILMCYEELRRKYGNTPAEILAYRDRALEEQQLYQNHSERLEELRRQSGQLERELNQVASSLSEERKKGALRFERELLKQLKDLNFQNAEFAVDISRRSSISEMGFDEVDFKGSFNLGQDLRSISAVASGGEMSRLMLAIKVILAGNDPIQTLIFDEVDAGLSGRTAQIIGEKILELAGEYQILVVTHLPQIAVLGNHHILIEKREQVDRTTTDLRTIYDEERVDEIARLIGGLNISELTRKSAVELLERAKKN